MDFSILLSATLDNSINSFNSIKHETSTQCCFTIGPVADKFFNFFLLIKMYNTNTNYVADNDTASNQQRGKSMYLLGTLNVLPFEK